MKKMLVAIALLLGLIGLFAWMSRRAPRQEAPTDEETQFAVQHSGQGLLYEHATQSPLRALRWMPIQPGGHQFVQVLTQNGRQRLDYFRNGEWQWETTLQRPGSLREGFFAFAQLQETVVLDDLALLLFNALTAGDQEKAWLVALDLKTQSVRWQCRLGAQHLAVPPKDSAAAIYAFGPAQIYRLDLVPKPKEMGADLERTPSEPLALPENIKEIHGCLPTGSLAFLLAHPGGLSIRNSRGEWEHIPSPLRTSPAIAPGRLVGTGPYYWQPFPGYVIPIQKDGRTLESPLKLQCPAPFQPDMALLDLQGIDPQNGLWFSVLAPKIITPSVAMGSATPESTEPQPNSPLETEALSIEDGLAAWKAHLSKGLDRVYRLDPNTNKLRVFNLPTHWGALQAPPECPRGLPELHTVGGYCQWVWNEKAWLLPLSSLPVQ